MTASKNFPQSSLRVSTTDGTVNFNGITELKFPGGTVEIVGRTAIVNPAGTPGSGTPSGSQPANLVFASPDGSYGPGLWRRILNADIDAAAAIAWAKISKLSADIITTLGFTPENVANKDTDSAFAANSDTKYPSQKAVKTALALKEDVANKDTDTTLAANSDTKYASQKAVKAYVDALIAASDAVVFKGVTNCSANPNYPAADAGHLYLVSVAGKIGGASGTVVEAGDMFICKTDGSSAGTQAGVGANWNVIQTNITFTPEDVANKDTDGTFAANSDTKYPSQKAVKTAMDLKAPLASPTFTGTPSAPTPSAGDNTTKLSTTAFVKAAIDVVLGGVSSAFDTLSEIATELALKATLASPTFTGTPAAPTASAGTNTTQLATTAFVKAAVDVVLGGVSAAYDTLAELAAAIGLINLSTWTNWTPTITQSGSVGNTVTYARYCIIGRTVHVQAVLAITAAGTTANAIVVGGLPGAVAGVNVGNFVGCGSFIYFRTGVAYYAGTVEHFSTTTLRFIAHSSGLLGSGLNFATANGDALGFEATWEI